jgi:hypothetical protein
MKSGLTGSRGLRATFDEDLRTPGRDGVSPEKIQRIGGITRLKPSSPGVAVYIELHIEQGF